MMPRSLMQTAMPKTENIVSLSRIILGHLMNYVISFAKDSQKPKAVERQPTALWGSPMLTDSNFPCSGEAEAGGFLISQQPWDDNKGGWG